MKILSHTLIKKTQLTDLQKLVGKQQSAIASATTFVKEIEQGNLDATLVTNEGDDQDILTSSLTSMRDQMKQFAMEERQRNWVTQGLAQFVDILRSKNNNLAELTDNIIRSLIRYMNANQGALYILNDDDAKETYLEMSACYAYDRKKYLNQRIDLGQGLTGQVILEKTTLYMTDVPKDFVRITSGLGEALPRNLVIVPLKIDQAVFGAIEIASFEPIPSYQIEFIEKLGESIASTISAVKVSERTKQLLGESQQQAEEMRAQEEEMRQNMEELSATQEDMQRVLREVQGKEQYMIDLINSSGDSILTVDRDLKVINCNTVFKKTYSGLGLEIEKGFDLTLLFPTEEEKNKYRKLYKRVFAGERFTVNEHYKFQDIEAFYAITYSPLTNGSGEIVAAAVFVSDITQLTKTKNEAQHQTEELKAQEEELRQNMEELSATQEEMQRVLKDVQGKERYMTDLINASSDSILTVDRNLKVITCNTVFKKTYSGMGLEIEKGFDLTLLFPTEEEKKRYRKLYSRVFAGERFEVNDHYQFQGIEAYYAITYAPITNDQGEITAAAVFVKDITQVTKANNEAQQQAEEVKAQEEELRQNMEELSATQDEMHRVLAETQSKERYLNELINVSTDAIFTLDNEFKILDSNQYFANRLKGMGVEVVKGFNILNLFKGEEQKKHQEDYQRALNGESFEKTSLSVINGHELYLNSSYSPMRDTSGAIVAMACFTKDITELMNAQKKAIDQQRYYNDVIEGMSDCVVTIDKEYKIIVANTAFKKVFSGYGLSVEPGASLLAMAKGDKKAEELFKKPYIRAFAGEHVEEPHRHHFDRDFQVSYNPLRDAQGEITGVSLIAHDITQRLQLSDQ